MKTLLYNWTSLDPDNNRGGGVTAHIYHLLEKLQQEEDHEVYFLSSEFGSGSTPRVVETKSPPRCGRLRSFVLKNSRVNAPGINSFGKPQALSDARTMDALLSFISRHHFNIIHLHSIEGVPADILSIKTRLAGTTVLLTVHNYHPICQQIQLFSQIRKQICRDYLDGRSCTICLQNGSDLCSTQGFINQQPLAQRVQPLVRTLSRFKSRFSRPPTPVSNKPTPPVSQRVPYQSDYFRHWREGNITAINDHIDQVFFVSELQASYFLEAGLLPEKYSIQNPLPLIEHQAVSQAPASKRPFTLSFWGYPTPNKGLDLFIDSLERLSKNGFARESDILIISNINSQQNTRLAFLQPRFNKIEIVRSYDASSMRHYANQTDLCIIPSIWAETYSLTAYELHQLGNMLLCSTTTGFAREHQLNDIFVFNSGDPDSLCKKIGYIIEHQDRARNELTDFQQRFPNTVKNQSLIEHYQRIAKR